MKDESIEIEIQAEGRDIENLGKDSEFATLAVTSAKDAVGRDVLKNETCGKDRNLSLSVFDGHMDGSFFKNGKFEKYRRVETKKSIRLQEGVSLKDIALLEGVINVKLPLETERVIVSAPFAEKVVERGGGSCSI